MNNIHYTIAKESDLKHIHALEARSFEADLISLKQYQLFHKNPYVIIFVAKSDHTVIASAVVMQKNTPQKSRIYTFAVDKEYRRKGIARKFLLFIEDYLKEKKCKEIELEVRIDNAAAIRLYEKIGYIKFGVYKHYYEDKMDAFRLKKKVNTKN